jgi:uncharacterized protein YkwD/uncharacterized membrane protein required for colicin V production
MHYVDFLIVAGLLAYVVASTRRGALALSADLLSLLVAVLVALRLYHPIAGLLTDTLAIAPSYAKALGFLFVLLATQVLVGAAAGQLVRLAPPHWHHARLNRYVGVAPAAARGLIVTGAILLLIVAMPATRHLTADIERATIGGPVLERATAVERTFASIFGDAIVDTLAFLTVPQRDGERVALPSTPGTLTVDPEAEAEMLRLVNQARASEGLRPLTIDPGLREVARVHSQDMWERQYFGHVDPDGVTPADRVRAGGVRYRMVGENLALAPTTQMAHRGLMNSPGHRRNIMDPAFSRVGIGVIDGGPLGKMYTQLFAD